MELKGSARKTLLLPHVRRESEKSDIQIALLAAEMDTQISAKERSTRQEERAIAEEKMHLEREKYEKRVQELQDAVSKLRKVRGSPVWQERFLRFYEGWR